MDHEIETVQDVVGVRIRGRRPAKRPYFIGAFSILDQQDVEKVRQLVLHRSVFQPTHWGRLDPSFAAAALDGRFEYPTRNIRVVHSSFSPILNRTPTKVGDRDNKTA
jgi:hypothetical protein